MLTSTLGSLLDGGALTGIAIQLLSARRRLSLRTDGELPTPGQLALGLGLFVSHCDTERAAEAVHTADKNEQRDVPHPHRELRKMRELLRHADVTYRSRAELTLHANRKRFRVLSVRHESEPCRPAYYLAWFESTGKLMLCVRGSKETSDLITNLSYETEPFLGGVGHRGIVQSARRLHAKLEPVMRSHARTHDVRRVVLTGHSMGAAVATAIALIMRDSGVDDVLQRAKCVAFSPPPFLSRRLASRTGRDGIITTIVCGLDIVPRLSAASLDRFILKIASPDWADQVRSTLKQATSAYIDTKSAESIFKFLGQCGGTCAAWAVPDFSAIAEGAPEHGRARSGEDRSSLWEGMLSLGMMASALVSSQFLAGHGGDAGRSTDEEFARILGMPSDDYERALVSEKQPEMFLAGNIIYFDMPFLSAEAFAAGEHIPAAKIKRAGRGDFRDVEGSSWMIYHHKTQVLLDQIDLMLQ